MSTGRAGLGWGWAGVVGWEGWAGSCRRVRCLLPLPAAATATAYPCYCLLLLTAATAAAPPPSAPSSHSCYCLLAATAGGCSLLLLLPGAGGGPRAGAARAGVCGWGGGADVVPEPSRGGGGAAVDVDTVSDPFLRVLSPNTRCRARAYRTTDRPTQPHEHASHPPTYLPRTHPTASGLRRDLCLEHTHTHSLSHSPAPQDYDVPFEPVYMNEDGTWTAPLLNYKEKRTAWQKYIDQTFYKQP